MGPQSSPPGVLVTVPPPPPASVRVRRFAGAKVAITAWARSIVSTHERSAPAQSPAQPVKTEPVTGVAVSVTDDPVARLAAHVFPQLIPPMSLMTLPDPVPLLVTTTVYVGTPKDALA